MDAVEVLRGRETVGEFFDQRRNLETLGAVSIMQIPFNAINGIGYGLGKGRDVIQKAYTRKVYNKALEKMV